MKRLCFLLLLVFCCSGASVLALGVTPPRIIVDDVLKGSTIEQSVTLVDVQEGDTVRVSFSGDGSQWVESVNGHEFLVESGKGQDVPFRFVVPSAAPNGEYTVIAQLTLTPSSRDGGGATTASVISALQVSLQFTITGEEVRKFEVQRVSVPDIEVGMPVTVVTVLKNQGNVLVGPSLVELDVKDKESRELLFSRSVVPQGFVDPFIVGESVALFTLDLDEDLYFADVRVFDGDELLVSEFDLPFDVLARGSLDADVRLVDLEVQDNVVDLAKISGVLSNDGSSGIFASLHAEVYFGDVLVDVLESDESYITEGDQQEFSLVYMPEEKGEYKVSAFASFSGKKSKTVEVLFVADPSGSGVSSTLLLVLTIVVFFASLCFGIVKAKKSKGRRARDGLVSQKSLVHH